MRRGCIRRLGAVAASRGVRAERHEDVAEGLEDGAGAVGLVGGACCAQRRRLIQRLLRGSKRGAAPFGDHLAVLEVCLDAVWGGEVVVAAYLVDVVAHQLGHAVGDRGVEELMELGDVGGAVAGGRRGVRRRGGGADGGAGEDARLRASRVDDPELRNLGQVRGVARRELGERLLPRGERVPAERHFPGRFSDPYFEFPPTPFRGDPDLDREPARVSLPRGRAGQTIGAFRSSGSAPRRVTSDGEASVRFKNLSSFKQIGAWLASGRSFRRTFSMDSVRDDEHNATRGHPTWRPPRRCRARLNTSLEPLLGAVGPHRGTPPRP